MEVRADTYLWAIRLFKSRTLAAEAIKGRKVKRDGVNFKASHLVKIGELYSISASPHKKVIEVTALLAKRASFEIAARHYVDRSPAPELTEKLPPAFFKSNIKREKGSGRPSKKERRELDELDYF